MKVSVITICRNAEKEIERTIKSILNQYVGKNTIEYIIIDGASTDKTVDIIKKYMQLSKNYGIDTKYISEPDTGVYNAMNKGTKLATGEWCIYMNAGDCFYNNNSLKHLLDETYDYDVVYGDTILKHIIRSNKKYELRFELDENEITFTHGQGFSHQSVIIKSNLIKKYLYSEKYKIVSDYDFFLKIYKQNAKFHHVKHLISIFSLDGISAVNRCLCAYEVTSVAYKYNMISKENYERKLSEIEKMKIRQKIHKYIPEALLKLRRKIKHLEPKLYTWEEIKERYD